MKSLLPAACLLAIISACDAELAYKRPVAGSGNIGVAANNGQPSKQSGEKPAEGGSAKEDAAKDKEELAKNAKPKFDVSGSINVFTCVSSPNVKYYDGSGKPEDIEVDVKSDCKSKKDTGGPNIYCGTAEAFFKANDVTEGGVRYGANLSLKIIRKDTGINNAFLYFEKDKRGTVQIGNVKGPDIQLIKCGLSLVGGASGADGCVGNNVELATGAVGFVEPVGFNGRASKIAYYTPILHGLQIGIAFTPDTKHSGLDARNGSAGDSSTGNDAGVFSKGKGDSESPSGRNGVAIGLSHKNEFSSGLNTHFSASFITESTKAINAGCYVGNVNSKGETYERDQVYDADGKATGAYASRSVAAKDVLETRQGKKLRLNNVKAFRIGGCLSYKEWSIAAGYFNSGKSRMPRKSEYPGDGTFMIPGGFITSKDGNAGQAWDFGIGYASGKWKFAGVYNASSRKVASNQSAKGNVITFTADYTVSPGLTLFAEVDHVSSRSCDYACAVYNAVRGKGEKGAIKKQNAVLFSVGAKLNF